MIVTKIVVLSLGKELFGIDISKVKEIICPVEITSVPNLPEFFEGLISLREEVIPIMDLAKRLNIPSSKKADDKKYIVVDLQSRTIALVVDSVLEVLDLPSNMIENTPELMEKIERNFISGIGRWEENLIILLNVERLFSSGELKQIEGL